MTDEQWEAFLLEFGRFREENQRQHGELAARIEATRGEILERMESQRADSEKAMRVLLLEIAGIGVVGFGAMVGALALLV